MIEYNLGIIKNVEFGLDKGFPFLMVLIFTVELNSGLYVSFPGIHIVNVQDKKSRPYQLGVMTDELIEILKIANVNYISELVNVPVGIFFEDGVYKSYQIIGGRKKMTAQKMFEELGYTNEDDGFYISYGYDEEHYFAFHKNSKEISIGYYHITLEELKAINKQVEELGWI